MSWTDLDEAAYYLVGSPLRSTPITKCLRASEAGPLLDAAVAIEHKINGQHEVPDQDVLTLYPCGHQLTGAAAHAYSVAALNLTWPDVRIEVTLILPPGVAGNETTFPTHQAAAHVLQVSDIYNIVGGPAAIIAAAVRSTAEQLARSIEHSAQDDTESDPFLTGYAAAGRPGGQIL